MQRTASGSRSTDGRQEPGEVEPRQLGRKRGSRGQEQRAAGQARLQLVNGQYNRAAFRRIVHKSFAAIDTPKDGKARGSQLDDTGQWHFAL